MATFMDIGLLDFFSNIFLFLFIFAAVYAIIIKTKIFGDSKNLVSIIAVAIAIIVVITKPVATFLLYIVPWFFVLAFVIMMFIFAGKLFGVSDNSISNSFHWKKTPILTWVIIFVVLILVFAFSNMFGQDLLEDNPEVNSTDAEETATTTTTSGNKAMAVDSDEYKSNVLATLTHPKVLGTIVILLVAMIAILLLTQSGFTQMQ